MTERGTLRDTYAAALQHDLITLDGDEYLVGVVRRPLPWLQGQVAENLPALGPPPDLLDEFKTRHETLTNQGLSDAQAHNQALADINYDARYRSHIEDSAEAQEALQSLIDRLNHGDDVVLVCYENTDEKRCHRTILKDIVKHRLNCPRESK